MSDLKGAPHGAQIQQLKRIEGQVRGIINMVEEQRYCIDILTQIKAAKSSLATIEKKIINEHMDHCVHKAIHSKDKKMADSMLEEIQELLKSRG